MNYEQMKKDIEKITKQLGLEEKHDQGSVYDFYTKKYRQYIQRKQPVFINPFEQTLKRTTIVSKSEIVKA